jgi:hypothetical protein
MTLDNEIDRLDFFSLFKIRAPVVRVQTLLAHTRRQHVVNIRQVRRLEGILVGLESDDPIVIGRLEGVIMSQWLFLYFGEQLLNYILGCQPPEVPLTDRGMTALAREIAARPQFRRLNCDARQLYAALEHVDSTMVRTHYRRGRKVEGHVRFYGTRPLLDLPYQNYPEFVVRMIGALTNVCR